MSDFPTREEIEVRAYEIYLNRGAEEGHDLDDWLQAEEELLLAAPASTAPRANAAAAGAAVASASAATGAGSPAGRRAVEAAAREGR